MRFIPLLSAWGCVFSFGTQAQVYTPVFPSLSGTPLYQALVNAYKPTSVLSYANARDTLFARVFSVDDDSVRCVYTEHALYLDRTQNPRQYLYQNGSSLGINTEHVYPQSKGAGSGNARSDMHHLYPARNPVNTARSNKPFAEIPDEQTNQWFYRTAIFTTPPTEHRDAYSESNGNTFEPREAVKGDIARAVFYFYTMYTAEALNADPNFFEQQRPTLCQWHYQDRADSAELRKTWRIAPYQENKPNPFILDCTLARRLYCPDLPDNCQFTSAPAPSPAALRLRFMPNPWTGPGRVEMILPKDGSVRLQLLSPLGQVLATWSVDQAPAGPFSLEVEKPLSLAAGIVFLEAIVWQNGQPIRVTMPVIVTP